MDDDLMNKLSCSICGGISFRKQQVLWPDLISEWEISEFESDYINEQQGCHCLSCGANLRIIALANAIRSVIPTTATLYHAVHRGELDRLHVLDCNGAEGLSQILSRLPHYQRADYPEYDMQRLPFPNGSFDLVIHSDTLEHIENPVIALEECRRVLTREGHLCFTVPVIHSRMTRSRAGLRPSYHGAPGTAKEDFLVHTEFGADVWTYLHRAGFNSVTINHVEFPAATALTAKVDFPLWDSEKDISRREEHDIEVVSNDRIEKESNVTTDPVYNQDGLSTVHNHEFVTEPLFQAAYARGSQAANEDYHWHWRVHTGLWAASTAILLPGDFIEFGVNRGFLSSAIMHYLDWNSTNRRFYLLDTFRGIDERYVSEEDIKVGVLERNRADISRGFYTFDVDDVRRNFSEWPNARVIQGAVPETLSQVDTDQIAFAHIDMNCAPPEIAAAEFIWPILTPGALVLLDDYAYRGCRSQKIAMDKFSSSKGVSILSLPTGQGLMIKPAKSEGIAAKPSRRSSFKKWW